MIPPVYTGIDANPTAKTLLTKGEGAGAILQVFPWGEAPQEVKPPYVTYTVYNGLPENTQDKPPELDNLGTQVDVFCLNAEQAQAVAVAVRNALQLLGHQTSMSDMGRDLETKLYRVRMDFDFFTNR